MAVHERTVDVRGATCPGGGALWALLSHVRDIPRGGSLELRTDDHMAHTDIPSWANRNDWSVEVRPLGEGSAFFVKRPS